MSQNPKDSARGNRRPSATASAEAPGARPAGAAPSRLLSVSRVALGIAALVAGYLTYASFTSGGVAGCGPEGGCSEVLNSRWSKWLGIPVSLPALALYLALLVLSVGLARGQGVLSRVRTEQGLRFGAWSVIGAAWWFFSLSAFVLHKFCPYCFAVHLSGTVGAVSLLKFLHQRGGAPAGGGMPSWPWTSQLPWAAALLGILAAGQILYVPATYRITSVPSGAPPTTTPATTVAAPAVTPAVRSTPPVPVPAPGPTAKSPLAPPAIPPPVVSLHNGSFRLDPTKFPLLGRPSATSMMVSQFDYTCEHCRRTHGPIREAQAYFSNTLAIICLPMPLDARCNEWLKKTPPAHTNACQFAALALGVWRAAPEKFLEYDDWLMSDPAALNVRTAFEHAKQLVGAPVFEAAITDPWVPETLQLSISLYRSNFLAGKSGAMPMMNIGAKIVTGTVGSAAKMFELLDSGLGLKRNP